MTSTQLVTKPIEHVYGKTWKVRGRIRIIRTWEDAVHALGELISTDPTPWYQLSKKIGVSTKTMEGYCDGTFAKPNFKSLFLVASYYGIDFALIPQTRQ